MKKVYHFLLMLIFFLGVILPGFPSGITIINNVVIDEAGKIVMIESRENKVIPKPIITKMLNPNRLVIDIPSSELGFSPKIIKVDNNDIKQANVFEVVSNGSRFVRIIIETLNNKSIDKVRISESDGSTLLQLDNITDSSTLSPNNNLVKINRIDYRDDQLIIGGYGQLKIKNSFVMKAPNRLVIDLLNTQVLDKKLLTPIMVGDKNVDVIRIGQFDDTTVRVVIETENPTKLYPIFGSDNQSLVITANSAYSPDNLPKKMSDGSIKSVKVIDNSGDGTIVRIESTVPLAHRVRRMHNPEKVIIDLVNVGQSRDDIVSRFDSTNELLGIKVGQLMSGNNNTRIVLDLASENVDTKANISEDGKIMEIALGQQVNNISFNKENSTTPTVVVDAGHGGYDPGCMANGYREKDITLDVAKRLKIALEKAGVKVQMVRTSDATVSLKERSDFTNSIMPDVFVSVHVNSSTNSAPEGISTHWYTNQSNLLAQKVQNAVINRVSAVDRGLEKNMFYVIHHTDVPAVLVEIGFLSNPTERSQMLTNERKQNTAQGIADGVLQFLKTRCILPKKRG